MNIARVSAEIVVKRLIGLKAGRRPGQDTVLDWPQPFSQRQSLIQPAELVLQGEFYSFGLIDVLACGQLFCKLINFLVADIERHVLCVEV